MNAPEYQIAGLAAILEQCRRNGTAQKSGAG
jgi:hypothetical protein